MATPKNGNRGDLITTAGDKAKVRLDERIEVELPIETARLVADALQASGAQLEAKQTELSTLQAKHDSLEVEVKDLKEKLDKADEVDVQKAVDERLELQAKARPHFDSDEDWDKVKKLTDKDLKIAAIKSGRPELELEGRDDAYIDAAFDMLKAPENKSKDLGRYLAGGTKTQNDSAGRNDVKDIESRIEKAIARDDDAYQFYVPGGLTSEGKTPAVGRKTLRA